MAYSDFKTVGQIEDTFGVSVTSGHSLFQSVDAVIPTSQLVEILDENIPLALNINTEKARSEMIITPVLIEVRKRLERNISLFSGVEFNVDAERNLNGYCDYILSRSPDQVFLTEPVACIVEAKNENIKSAYPQCITTMIAAQIFNDEHGHPMDSILGVVTTDSNWKFLKLHGNAIVIDFDEYLISQIDKILGIFVDAIGTAILLKS
ncbi:MAG: hypothetical protein OEU26_12755 [Candidatus Tectomicrobia bacterium]|nr:hypothetical protein [Candidatus Tectomicrobia bacterium]